MNLLDIMRARRSVRKYTDDEITEAQMSAILQAGLLGPSGKGRCPQELIVVRDKKMLMELAKCRQGAAKMLEGAAAAIVVVGDSEKADTWVEDCSVAITNMHLMADSLGLGSCWIQGRGREAENGEDTESFVRNLMGFPENFKLEAILSIGVPASHPAPRTKEDLDMSKVHREKF